MTSETLIKVIREVITEELEIPAGSLHDGGSLRADYGLDSVAAVNIAFTLETRLGVEIDIKRFASIDSISDLKLLLADRTNT